MTASEGPLSGLLVLDLSRILAGPTATQLFADLGADVIKVERAGEGDDTRRWGPPFAPRPDGSDSEESAYYLCANRNKRSLAIDLAREEGQAVCRRIAARADIVVENFKLGGAERLGLGYAALSALNPRLIYCSITGFGQTGPLAAQAGYDFAIQARSGLMSVTGAPDGPPTKVGVAMSDVTTGLYAAVAVLAALEARHRTGRGQAIDLALFDCQLAALVNQATAHLMTGRTPRRYGNGHPTIVPYAAFETADGPFVLAIGNDGQFRKFCAAAGAPALAADPRFATNRARVENREACEAAVTALTRTRPAAAWIALLDPLGVPAGPINTLPDAFADPQAIARGARVDQAHPVVGSVATVANPIRFSETPVAYRRPPPTRGEHSGEILAEFGFDAAEIAALGDSGAVEFG